MRYLIALTLLIATGCARQHQRSSTLHHLSTRAYLRGNKDTTADCVIIFIHSVFGGGIATWTNKSVHTSPALVRVKRGRSYSDRSGNTYLFEERRS